MTSESTQSIGRAATLSGCGAAHRLFFSLVMLFMTAFAIDASAQGPLTVSMMPSYSQNLTYANAAINEPIQVWGRVSGGTGTYNTYTLDFGDGTPPITGSVNNSFTTFQIGGRDFIQSTRAYTTGGSKTVTLTVSDSSGASASRTAVIRVLLNPTHDERVNMAIEKGLIYLYRTQQRTTLGGQSVSYWYSSGGAGANAAVGASLMCFGENGHLASNDPALDVYADTVTRGIKWTVTRGRNMAIGMQTDGNPDANGNGRGIYFDDGVAYAHGFMTMGVINAFPNAAAAQAATIPPALWSGGGAVPANYYDFIQDSLDQFSWSQGDTGYKGWHYQMTTSNSGGGGFDGSTHQWPNIAILSAEERWGITPPNFVVANSMYAYRQGTDQSGGAYDGGLGYSGPTSWRNTAKTGGALVGYYLGGKLIGSDADADRAFAFIKRFWTSSGDYHADGGGWVRDFYAMFALKKGLQLQGVTTLTTPDGGIHDWYREMSGWLLGNEAVLDGAVSFPPVQVTYPSTINSITFEVLQSCGSGTFQFSLNGVALGSMSANPTSHCTCTPPLTTFTVTNAGLLSNWIAGAGNNSLSFTFSGGDYLCWVRAKIVSGATTHTAYLFDAPGGSVGDTNFCSAGYVYHTSLTAANNALFSPVGQVTQIGLGLRTLPNAFGQQSDGSWGNGNSYPGSYGPQLTTPHAILVLTKAITIPLPVAVIAAVGDQSSRFPAPFNLNGSGSYHQDTGIPLVEYLWDLDASNGVDWNSPDASGPTPTVNPGWTTNGPRTITLRVKDNQNPALTATATTVVNVTAADVAPVALAMPPSQVPQIYTGTLGSTIVLDGTASYDVDGDAIEKYEWDLNGDGQYATAADIALDTSGNLALGSTASVVYNSPNNSQVGLKVYSTPRNADGVALGPQKSGVSTKPIDVYASSTDLYVSALSATNMTPTVSADISATLTSAAGSIATSNVVVRFYNGNPLTGGVQVGGSYLVNIPAGGSSVLNLPGFALGGTSLLWAFVDANNLVVEYNEANNTANVNVANQPPVAIAQNVTVSAGGDCTAAASIDNGSSDPDAGDSITLTQTPAGPYAIGLTNVTLTVTDSHGVSSTATATVTVVDDTRPVFTDCPANIVVQTGPGRTTCDQVATWVAPIAMDNCALESVVSNYSSGDTFPIGVTPVTYTATDKAGLTAICSFTVTVVDNTPPVLTIPDNIVVSTDAGQCSAAVAFAVSASDNCPTVESSTDIASGTAFPKGTTTVTATATDAAGNMVSDTFTVTVNDTEDPVLTVPANIVVNNDPGLCSAVVTFSVSATDNCPDVTTGTDIASGTAFAKGVTTVTATAEDASGNQVTKTFTVTVNDNEKPVISCPPAVSVAFAAQPVAATTTAGFVAQGGAIQDNCDADPAVTSTDAVAGLCPTVITRTYTVTDASGNASICVQTITVNNLFAGDGIVWHQPLARNGASEDTDPSAGGTLKYRFKLNSTIPIQIHVQGCSGGVTSNSNVTGKVVVFGDTDMDGVLDAGELAIDISYNGVGGSGGVMDRIDGHLKYNLDTKKLPPTQKCYILQVTVTDTSTGESRVETVPLQAK